MQLMKMLARLKRKRFEPTVYAVTVAFTDGKLFQQLIIEYRQEDAIDIAKKNSGSPSAQIEQVICTIVSVRELVQKATEMVIEEEVIEKKMENPDESTKSQLMARIIKSKDMSMIDRYRGQLSNTEIRYLEDKLS